VKFTDREERFVFVSLYFVKSLKP